MGIPHRRRDKGELRRGDRNIIPLRSLLSFHRIIFFLDFGLVFIDFASLFLFVPGATPPEQGNTFVFCHHRWEYEQEKSEREEMREMCVDLLSSPASAWYN